MKMRSLIFGVAAAGLVFGAAVAPRASAAVNDTDFNALKDMVIKQGERLDQLDRLHEQDQKLHQQDQEQIRQLKLQLGETQAAATNAAEKAEAASHLQPAAPVAGAGPSATHNFMVVGDAEVQFGKSAGSHSAFVLADFAPIFLFRASDNVLFEAGFDVTLANGSQPGGGSSTHVDLSFAQLDYLLNDYVTVIGGDMVLPLGTYSERAAGWLNKIPDDPLARDFLPGSGVGMQLRGAVPVGQAGQMVTYSAYAVNGPSSIDTTGVAGNLDLSGNVGDTPNWHANPSGGGRLGWFAPLKPHYDLELGISGQSGEWDNNGSHSWSAAVLDASIHISPYFEIKGEYINTWYGTDDLGNIHPRGEWVQAGYKLAGLDLNFPFINNVELVGRFDHANDGLGTKTDRYTMGYVYYFSNTLLFEGDYEFLHSRGPNALPVNQFVLQLSYGF